MIIGVPGVDDAYKQATEKPNAGSGILNLPEAI